MLNKQKNSNAIFRFCFHFSWAELKHPRLFLRTPKARFSQMVSQIGLNLWASASFCYRNHPIQLNKIAHLISILICHTCPVTGLKEKCLLNLNSFENNFWERSALFFWRLWNKSYIFRLTALKKQNKKLPQQVLRLYFRQRYVQVQLHEPATLTTGGAKARKKTRAPHKQVAFHNRKKLHHPRINVFTYNLVSFK